MALDLNALNAGIYTKLTIKFVDPDWIPTDLMKLVTGVYHLKAPQGQAFPYITYFVVSSVPDNTFTHWHDIVLLQIDIWSQERKDVSALKEVGIIEKAVAAQMDEAEITANGYSVYMCLRVSSRLLYEMDVKTFHKILEYRIKMERPK